MDSITASNLFEDVKNPNWEWVRVEKEFQRYGLYTVYKTFTNARNGESYTVYGIEDHSSSEGEEYTSMFCGFYRVSEVTQTETVWQREVLYG